MKWRSRRTATIFCRGSRRQYRSCHSDDPHAPGQIPIAMHTPIPTSRRRRMRWRFCRRACSVVAGRIKGTPERGGGFLGWKSRFSSPTPTTTMLMVGGYRRIAEASRVVGFVPVGWYPWCGCFGWGKNYLSPTARDINSRPSYPVNIARKQRRPRRRVRSAVAYAGGERLDHRPADRAAVKRIHQIGARQFPLHAHRTQTRTPRRTTR